MMSVPVELGSSLTLGTPQVLFRGNYHAPYDRGQFYDVSPDGQKFLMIRESSESEVGQIIIVQNWFEEITRVVPGVDE